MAKHALSLGPYGLLAPIGKGAAGQVWRAWHPESGTPLAIKIMHGPRPDTALRAMQQELRAVARMDHPGIVRVHDHGRLPAALAPALDQAPDSPYIVMDFAGRRTLRSALAKRPWPAMRAILLALLDALAHAHARGVIHRDLKPDNVLLGPSGPVLTDFGIALAYDQADNQPSSGTPNYMAPEQVRDDHRAIGPWSDLYALGCLSYALASGRAPFAGRGSIGALRGHLQDAPARLEGAWPPAFADWVARLLAKSPRHRYRLAADAADDLAAIPSEAASDPLVPIAPLIRAPAPLPDWQRPEPPRPTAMAGVHRPLVGLRQIDPVGRGAEQGSLWRALAGVVTARRLRVVLIEGSTGSGRTHLARWLTRRAHELGVAECLTAEYQPPVGAVDGLGSMMAEHLRIGGLTGSAAVARTAEALDLEPDDPGTAAIAAVAAPGRQVVDGDRVVRLLGPGEFEATLSMALGHLTSRRPHILLIDDAQWAPEAVAFVQYLLERCPDLPLLVVLTVARDRLDPRQVALLGQLAAHPMVDPMRLERLGDDAIAEMVRRLAPVGPGLVESLVARAAGDPSRAAGLLRLWSEQAVLAQDGDGLRLIASERPMPADDDGLWLERLGQVPGVSDPSIWSGLELAATFGHPIAPQLWTALARRAGAPDGPAFDGVLADLSDAGLVLDDARGWRLAHGRIRDALVRRARDGGRLAGWHRICAATLAEAPDARPEHLAIHRMAAGDPAGAVEPFIAAAIAARRQTGIPRIRRALIGAARALRAARTGRDDPRWIELHARWALADVSRGRLERARRRARRADRRAEDPRGRALAAYALGEATLGIDPRAAELHIRRAEGHARSAGLTRLAMRCAEARGWSLFHRGRFDPVDRLVQATLAASASPDGVLEANLHFLRAVAARGRNDPQAASYLDQAANLYRAAGARHGQASVRNEMGEVALSAGRLEEALDHYRASRLIFEALGHRSVIVADLNLGRVNDALGRHRAGETHRRQALRLAERHGDPAMMAFAGVCLLVDTARRGRFDLWPARFVHLGALESGALVAAEAAEAARDAAGFAEAAGAGPEARRAFRLAAVQFERLDRTAEADEMDRRAAALVGQSEWDAELSGDPAGSGRPSGP